MMMVMIVTKGKELRRNMDGRDERADTCGGGAQITSIFLSDLFIYPYFIANESEALDRCRDVSCCS